MTSAIRPQVEQLEGRDLPAPLAPTGVVATGISASAVALAWNVSPDPSVTGYDVYSKVWVAGSHGGKGSSGGGHYVYNLLASDLPTHTDTVTGLKAGTGYTYLVTAVSSQGQSPFSLPAVGETWIAPSLPYGPNTFLLSVGALWSGPVNVTAGQTTQVSLLIGGNPLTYSIISGPSTASINPTSGVVTFTPTAHQVGPVNVQIQASNALGAVTQTIPFNVIAANTKLAIPKLSLNATKSIYTGTYQQVTATAVGKKGAAVAGTYAIAYNGGARGAPLNAGTYQVLVTFTSLDPAYASATLLTSFTITKATPVFSNLSSPAIAVGAATTTVSGSISAGTAIPTGDYVIVTLNGTSQETSVDVNGNFSTTFATGALPVGSYVVTCTFPGDSNFNAAASGLSTLNVVPLAAPQVNLNPGDVTTTVGDGVTFTATATGSPTISVQWQVSTDGGQTFTDVTGNTSALSTTLSFAASASQNGYQYRAVLTNSAGSTTTSIATLKVNGDDNGN